MRRLRGSDGMGSTMATTTSPPPTPASESRERGRAARAATPRSSHADWTPSPGRRSPIDVLREQDATRVADLVPVRYGRMLVSPFTFYRGAAALMADDLEGSPASGIAAQLCGDAHLSNFGVFAAPDRRLVFDLNDFDETHPGPWEWDVKRLAASVEIAGRDRGFKRRDRRKAVLTTVQAYREAMRDFAAKRHLDVWYARLDVDSMLTELSGVVRAGQIRSARKTEAKALGKDSARAMAKFTERVDGRTRIINDPPLVVPIREMLPDDDARDVETEARALISDYTRSLSPDRRRLVGTYRYVDMAHKVVGVGSVGSRAWIILLEGRDDGDPLVLQAKEAGPSVLEGPLGSRSRFRNHGARVVEGQRFMQAASDIFLGWQRVKGLDGGQRDFYVRQLWDGKGSVVVENMQTDGLGVYGRLCGWTLARAHARSGDRIAIAAYLGTSTTFDEAVATFSEVYADQNEHDYAELRAAVGDGTIAAVSGV
jgi:uncharacterized protein (DUF2252 family)